MTIATLLSQSPTSTRVATSFFSTKFPNAEALFVWEIRSTKIIPRKLFVYFSLIDLYCSPMTVLLSLPIMGGVVEGLRSTSISDGSSADSISG